MKPSVLVVGCGFIGGAIARHLARDRSVRVLSRSSCELPETVRFTQGLIEHPDDVVNAAGDASTLIIATGGTTPSATCGQPLLEAMTSMLPTLKLLESLALTPVKTVVFLSSGGAVYGSSSSPLKEGDRLQPRSDYGAAKASLELFLQTFCAQRDLTLKIIRPTNVYGPGQRPRRGFAVIPTLFECILSGKPFTLLGSGEEKRDYLFIDDLVQLVSSVLDAPEQGSRHGCLNAGSGVGHSLNQLIDHIEAVTSAALTVKREGMRPGDVASIVLDCERAQKMLGWTAQTRLPSGLRTTWDWYRAHR